MINIDISKLVSLASQELKQYALDFAPDQLSQASEKHIKHHEYTLELHWGINIHQDPFCLADLKLLDGSTVQFTFDLSPYYENGYLIRRVV